MSFKSNLCAGITATVMLAAHPLSSAPVTITRADYHGWPDCLILRNGLVEAVVVPAIGRVMQFGYAGETGVFWENRTLDGRTFTGEEKDWTNLGGDKAWPAPEDQWGRFTGRKDWWPPRAFDGLPYAAKIEGETVVLISPEDVHYGIRLTRRISLAPAKPQMTITTTYERIKGEAAAIGIWVITQLKDPVAVFAPLPAETQIPEGFALLSKTRPPSLARLAPAPGRKMLKMERDPKSAHKIGCEAGTLIWVGAKFALRIDSARVPGGQYPDQGSSAEIYTNPGNLDYVELELLGPLHSLKAGDKIERTNVYTLSRALGGDPVQDAVRMMGW